MGDRSKNQKTELILCSLDSDEVNLVSELNILKPFNYNIRTAYYQDT